MNSKILITLFAATNAVKIQTLTEQQHLHTLAQSALEAEFIDFFTNLERVGRGIAGENYVDPCPDMDPFEKYWCNVGKGWEGFWSGNWIGLDLKWENAVSNWHQLTS